MSEHAFLAPSSAYIWVHCAAHPGLAAQYPELETDAAREGTAVHELAYILIDMFRANPNTVEPSFIGTSMSNGVEITAEMEESARLYVEDAMATLRAANVYGGEHLALERRLDIPSVHMLNDGTPDLWMYDKNKHELFVWDFKYGHRWVDAWQNWQLLNYAIGVLDHLGMNGGVLGDQTLCVHLRVVQPRAYGYGGPIRTWSIWGHELRGYANQLHDAAERALLPDPPAQTGPHCQFCPARGHCSKALEAGLTLFEAAGTPAVLDPTPQALGFQLSLVRRAIKALEALDTAYATQVEQLLAAGKLVPGWGMGTSVGHNYWTAPFEEIKALGELFGVSLAEQKLVSPAQAKKLGIDADVIKQYTARLSSTKLVPDNTTRALTYV